MDPSEKPNGAQKRAHPAPGPHYRECLRNHAASLGTHALDGCGEFFPSPPPSSPLTCSACGCHRNFHRKVASRDPGDDDDDEDSEDEAGSHVLLTLKTGAAAAAGPAQAAGPARRKRFRSRFTREQKEGMMELAERLGWRLQRREEGLVEHGCRAIGVERGVFKVWMHNNKQAVFEMKRRSGAAQSRRQGENNGGGDRKANGDHKGSSSSSPSSRPL